MSVIPNRGLNHCCIKLKGSEVSYLKPRDHHIFRAKILKISEEEEEQQQQQEGDHYMCLSFRYDIG